jgi:hypothetical protein
MPTVLEWSEIIRNYAIVGGGLTGLAVAIWRAIAADRQSKAQSRQAEQGRREHVAAIFGRAVEQLDHENLHVRLGAIYTLREIVDAFPDLSRPTVDLLASYLASVNYADEDPPLDVQEVMKIVIPRRMKVMKR